MEIEILKKPKLEPTKMNCDKDLHKRLNDYELTKYLGPSTGGIITG